MAAREGLYRYVRCVCNFSARLTSVYPGSAALAWEPLYTNARKVVIVVPLYVTKDVNAQNGRHRRKSNVGRLLSNDAGFVKSLRKGDFFDD